MIKKITQLICVTTLLSATTLSYGMNNFTCPSPEEIQSTDFTAPSIWVAPPVAHSVPNQVGVGLGGNVAKKLLGTEKAMVNHKEGWVCVYLSEGGVTVNDYKAKIRSIVSENKFLTKYLNKVNKAFEEAEPYLKNYPKDKPIGFIGYQLQN